MIHRALNDGGYLEIQAFEPIVRKRDEPENFDHPLNIFFRLLCKETLPDLKTVHPVEDLVDALGAAGFTEVEVMTQLVPIGQQQDMVSFIILKRISNTFPANVQPRAG